MKTKEYTIWKCNKFNDEILTSIAGIFYDLQIAKDFVEYQASIGNTYAIMCEDERIDL